ITSPLPRRRTFLALALTMVWPIDTWPSPPIATTPPLRTVRMVVPCQRSDCGVCIRDNPAGPSCRQGGGRMQTGLEPCGLAQGGVDAGLPAFAARAEMIDHVAVEPQRNEML